MSEHYGITIGDRCSREWVEQMPDGVLPPLDEPDADMILCPECGGERCDDCDGTGQVDPFRDVPLITARVDVEAIDRMMEGAE